MTEHGSQTGGVAFAEEDDGALVEARALLASAFGHPSFRAGQEKVVLSVMGGRDTLAVMPTGGGKSLCYQVPALLGDGLTVVVCPLVSLMKDQRESLLRKLGEDRSREISALHSGLSADERRRAEDDIISGQTRILFVAPERLRSLEFCLLLKRRGVSLIVVDEAHCISEWGHDFRPDYLFVGEAARDLKDRDGGRPPVLALTATADARVRSDVVSLLGLGGGLGQDHEEVLTGFDRPNLRYAVEEIPNEGARASRVLELLQTHERPAIVYAHTRRQTEHLAASLAASGLARCEAYHAGLKAAERDRVQERFMRGQTDVICATVAFGMGIDKPNVRTVIHASLPASLSAYVQEAGRAGRDGGEASCTVLYAPGELARRRGLVSSGETTTEDALHFFEALRARATPEAGAGAEATARLGIPEGELLALGGLAPGAARDAFAALEAVGRVKRRYNLWASVRFRTLPRDPMGDQSGPKAPDPGSPAGRVLAALTNATANASANAAVTLKLADLAARAGVSPPTAQVLLTKLDAVGLIEAEGRGGVLPDVLVKTAPLDRREAGLLAEKLSAGRTAALDHLDAIERYASPAACRRQRILDHFEEDRAPRVAPCGGCDVCRRGGGATKDGAPNGPGRGLWGRLKDLFRKAGYDPGHGHADRAAAAG